MAPRVTDGQSSPIQQLPNELITLIFVAGSTLALEDQKEIFSNPPGKPIRKRFIKLVHSICRHWRNLVDHLNPSYEQIFWITNIPFQYEHKVTPSLSYSIIKFKEVLSRSQRGELALQLAYHDSALPSTHYDLETTTVSQDPEYRRTYLRVRLLIHTLGFLRDHRMRISIVKSNVVFLPIMADLMQMLYQDIPPSCLSIFILDSPLGGALVKTVDHSYELFCYQPIPGATRLWPPEAYPAWRKVDTISPAHPSLSLYSGDIHGLRYLGPLANIVTSLVIDIDTITVSETVYSEYLYQETAEYLYPAIETEPSSSAGNSYREPETNHLSDNGATHHTLRSPATRNAKTPIHDSFTTPRPTLLEGYLEDIRFKPRNAFGSLTQLDLILLHPIPFEYPIIRLFDSEASPLDSLKVSWEPVGYYEGHQKVAPLELHNEALARMSTIQATAWKIRWCELRVLGRTSMAHQYFMWLVNSILRHRCSSCVEIMTLRSKGTHGATTTTDLSEFGAFRILRFPQLREVTLDLQAETTKLFLRDSYLVSPILKVVHLVLHPHSDWVIDRHPFNFRDRWNLSSIRGLRVLDLQLPTHLTWKPTFIRGLASYLAKLPRYELKRFWREGYLAERRGGSESTAHVNKSFPNPELEVVVIRPVSYPATPIHLLPQQAIRYDLSLGIFGLERDTLINLLHRAIRTRLEGLFY